MTRSRPVWGIQKKPCFSHWNVIETRLYWADISSCFCFWGVFQSRCILWFKRRCCMWEDGRLWRSNLSSPLVISGTSIQLKTNWTVLATKSQREVYLHTEILGLREHKHQKNCLVLMFYYLIFYYTWFCLSNANLNGSKKGKKSHNWSMSHFGLIQFQDQWEEYSK